MTLILLATLMLAQEPITEISFERTPCFGRCPVDKVTLRSDGTAEYIGTRFVKNMGKHTGKIARDDFEKLARLVVDRKFFDLEDRYARPITDQATLITTVKRGKQTKEVSNYGNAAPRELGEIEKQIIGLMEKIEWTRAEAR